MKLGNFEMDLGTVDASAIGQAAFFAMIGAGWSMYASSVLALSARGGSIANATDEERAAHAAQCFRYVVQWMPDGHPFRKEVERYIFEALPLEIKLVNLPSPAW